MEKLFAVAGTSNLNGVVKFRFANDLKSRVKILERNGHTDINLLELPNAMTKQAAREWLAANTEWELPAVGKVEDAAVEDATTGEQAGEQADEDAAEITEEQIEAAVAEMCANGRPRNSKGHFIKMEELRRMAAEQLQQAQ